MKKYESPIKKPNNSNLDFKPQGYNCRKISLATKNSGYLHRFAEFNETNYGLHFLAAAKYTAISVYVIGICNLKSWVFMPTDKNKFTG